MAINKKMAKPVSKKPASKTSVSNLNRKGPLKKAIKVVAKAVKNVAKSIKKSLPVKKVVLSTPKKTVKPNYKNAPAKKTTKPAAKKVEPKKVTKPVNKPTPAKKVKTLSIRDKKSSTPMNKVAASIKKTVPVSRKKIEVKTPVLKPLPKAKDIKVAPPKPVVLPKITATKARKYEPGFTKSILDHTPQENNGPTMRYSDSELTEFRELIQRKLETAKKELGYLQGLITRKDEMGGDDTDNRYMTMEDGSLSMEREQLSQMASRQITFIDHLEKAMMRIENKTYGICRVTGKLIDKARLRAVPHATLSIEAKMGIAK
jgi:RNA polymerase-binding transcription factor DksA